MSWLARLKSLEAPKADPREPGKPGSLGSQGCPPEPLQHSAGHESDAEAPPAPACADCTHCLPRGTCAQPEAAGLIPAGAGFGIVWPEPGHADGCTAFEAMPGKATDRPYRLSRSDADTAHAEPWDDAAIGRFQARVQRIRRRGFGEQDADDLAEWLHLRDVHADHRALCLECRHLAGTAATGWRCGNHNAAAVARELPAELVTTFQVCPGFSPAR